MRLLVVMLLLNASIAVAGPVPEPDPITGCPVPPIPNFGPPSLVGMGYRLDAGLAWFDFNLNGRRYEVEFSIKKQHEDGTVQLSPFPVNYYFDFNRNGQFDIPGEIWIDSQGNGRCADLELLPAPVEDGHPKSKKPIA